MLTILPKFREDMLLRGFSPHTIRSYTERVRDYLTTLDKPLSETTEYDMRRFQLNLQNVRQLSPASVNVYMAAVRYLYEINLCRHMNWKIAPRMKNPHKLPEFPTHGEIQRIFDNSPSLKSRAMFMLAYSAGLRISEIAPLV